MLGKRLINSNSAASGATCTTDTLNILGDSPNSCVAYYKMSDATDESGSYDGTPTSVNFNVQGKFGNAGSFNGSSSKIVLPASTVSTILSNGSFAISVWFNTSTTGTRQFIFSAFQSSYLMLEVTTGNQLKGTVSNSVGTNTDLTVSTTVTDGNWHHAVFTGDNGSLALYLDNGTPQTSTSWNGSFYSSTGGVGIGIKMASSDYWNGSIDQLRIFDTEITAANVTTLHNEVYCVPTIVPTDNFNPVLYTGNGGTKSITSLDFEPDFTWVKNRDVSNTHLLYDSIRGAGKFISSATTGQEQGNSGDLLASFDSNGFTVNNTLLGGTNPSSNANNEDFVAWNWKAGGADVQNTDGTITSQVSANTDAGFSIVKTSFASGQSSSTVGHGLNEAPTLIIVKRTDATEDWYVKYNVVDGSSDQMRLNTAVAQEAALFTPTSNTVIGFGVTGAAHTTISYCFHSVDGYSKIGSYTGTGTTLQTIVTGFRPAFVLIKNSTYGNIWIVLDNKRNTSNPINNALFPSSSQIEYTFPGTPNGVGFVSNGFTLNTATPEFNQPDTGNSGGEYIFMAFAEEVFNPSGVTRNATNPFGDSSELALYKFEDDADDAEGNYDGVFTNPAYATGYIDKAAVFNGSSSRITSGLTSGLTGTYSVSAWFTQDNISTDTAHRDLISYMDADGSTGWWIGKHNNTSQWRILGVTGVSIVTMIAQAGWNHIAVVKDSSTVYVYLNGSEVSSFAFPGYWNLGTGNTSQFNIGTQYTGTSEYWDGSIDQVRIFNRALDSGEVTQLYNE